MKLGSLCPLLGVAVACNAILGNEEPTLRPEGSGGFTSDASGDGSSAGGSSGSGGSGGAVNDASIDAAEAGISCDDEPEAGEICPGGVMYVSKSGSEANSGCTPCTPKLTVRSALEALNQIVASYDAGAPPPIMDGGKDASTNAAADANADAAPSGPIPRGFEIRVCEGSYPEVQLSLNLPVSLKGGYDCTTWRRTSAYAYPTFDATNETRVTNGAYALQPTTFVVSGAEIDRGVAIDGLTFEGSATGASGSTAVAIAGGASPIFSNDQILGGATTNSAASYPGSVGLYVSGGASPEIRENNIDGGSGTQTLNRGSVGLYLEADSGAPYIHDNIINGGSGTSTTSYNGSVGALLQSALPMTQASDSGFVKNVVYGGTGTGGVAFGEGTTVGIIVTSVNAVDVIQNEIHAGDDPTDAAAATMSLGIYSSNTGSGTVTIAQNRIDAGRRLGLGSQVFGVDLNAATSALILNNMIHGGRASARSAPIIALYSASTRIAYNTLFGGVFTDQTAPIGQIWFVSSTGADVHSNILAGPSGSVTSGIRIDSPRCPADPLTGLPIPSAVPQFFSRLRNNLFVGNDSRLAWWDQNSAVGCSSYLATTVAQLAALVAPGESAGNLAVKDTCAPAESGTCILEPSCGLGLVDGGLPDAGPPVTECMRTVFASWTDADSGLTELLSTGWLLRPNSLCSISGGGYLDTTLGTLGAVDLFGTNRTNPRSIGAHEFNDPCQ
jgi:hypothetical protein